MSYVNTPSEYYRSTVGPFSQPGWRSAPVPGWGVDTLAPHYSNRVGVGNFLTEPVGVGPWVTPLTLASAACLLAGLYLHLEGK